MAKIAKLYHTSRPVMIAAFALELLIAYGFACLSINRGNLWWYLLTLIFLVASLKSLVRFIGSFIPHGHKRK